MDDTWAMHTDIRGWLGDLSADIRSKGVNYGTVVKPLRGAFNGLYFTVTTRVPLGTNVFERDWDLLVVLDACRVDALRALQTEYAFIEDVDAIWSVGSSSHEWIAKTFTNQYRREIERTVHLTTNPFIPQVFDDRVFPPKSYRIPLMLADWDVVEKAAFKRLLKVHRHDHEDLFAPTPPTDVTDYAIDAGRSEPFERMIVHYFQPHTPFISGAYRERRPVTEVEAHPYRSVRRGIATADEIWRLYLDNLRLALDSVGTLLRNIDAPEVVITADHGDLFGELGAFGHPEGFVHPNLKRVPWATATATDHGERVPAVDVSRQTDAEFDAEERLERLGYL